MHYVPLLEHLYSNTNSAWPKEVEYYESMVLQNVFVSQVKARWMGVQYKMTL